MKKGKIRISGSAFSVVQKCPASTGFEFSRKLMTEHETAQAGTDAHEAIAADIATVERFLPKDDVLTVQEVEQRLGVPYGLLELSGGVDYYAVGKNTLYVIDWKTGPAGIDHLPPDQIEFYAFLVLKTLPAARLKKLTDVSLSYVSPRLNQKKTFTMTRRELEELVTGKLDAVVSSIKKGAKLAPGDHCRYCSARFVCPALKAELKKFAEPKFQGKALAKITAEDLRVLSIAAAAITDVRSYVSELIENGEKIPGVRVEYQTAARFFSEGVDAFMVAEKLGTSKVSVMEPPKLKSPAQLEKAGFDLSAAAELISTSSRKVLKVEKVKQEGTAKKQKIKVKGRK